jgi:hypothetical protein
MVTDPDTHPKVWLSVWQQVSYPGASRPWSTSQGFKFWILQVLSRLNIFHYAKMILTFLLSEMTSTGTYSISLSIPSKNSDLSSVGSQLCFTSRNFK